MNKMIKYLAVVGIFVFLLAAAFHYFFISGKTVAKLFGEYENYEVTITKSSSLGEIDSEIVLTSKQKEMFKNLLTETSFRRVVANMVFTNDTTRYELKVNGTHQTKNDDVITGVLFYADSTGGEYLLIREFNGKHLRIYNNQWNARMDEILALSTVI